MAYAGVMQARAVEYQQAMDEGTLEHDDEEEDDEEEEPIDEFLAGIPMEVM